MIKTVLVAVLLGMILAVVCSLEPRNVEMGPDIPEACHATVSDNEEATRREVRVTVYHPTGNPTASGDRIPSDYRRKEHGWVAVSRELLEYYPMNSVIELEGISPEVDGKYIVKDKTGRRIKNTVDILVRQSSPLYGKWRATVRLSKEEET